MKSDKRGRPSKQLEYSRRAFVQNKARARIKAARKRAGIKELQLAKLIGIAPESYHDIESRRTKAPVTKETAEAIADALKAETGIDYNPAYLAGMSEAMTMQEAQTFRAEKEAKIEAIRRRNESSIHQFGVLTDAAATQGMTLRSIIDPEIDNPSVLSYLQSVTWSKQIPDRIFLLERDGQPVKQLSGEEYERLAAKLRDYAAQLIDEAITE